MMRATASALLLLVGLAGSTHATAPVTPSSRTGMEAALRHHIEVLASDAYGGRKTGTDGEAMTIAYIAEQLAAAGFSPDGEQGSWFQPVPLTERMPQEASAKLLIRRGSISIKPDYVIVVGRDAETRLKKVPVMFGGYGHQLGNADVAGKVVMLLSDTPPDGVKPVAFAELRAALAGRGAVGTILVAPPGSNWNAISANSRGARYSLSDDAVISMSAVLAREVVTVMALNARTSITALVSDAGKPDFVPYILPVRFSVKATTAVRSLTGRNVVARLKGKADGTKGAIGLSAHHDHLGQCRPVGSPDTICNGAVDNASGIAMMIEVARALANGPRLARDIVLVATTAEELGLLGARYHVRSLGSAKADLKAVVNMDTVAINPKGAKVGVVGRGMTALDPLIDLAAKQEGRAVDTDPDQNALVRRQDGWAFLEAGVPAVMVGGYFTDKARLTAFFDGPYHQPNDDVARGVELGGAVEDAALVIRLTRMLADPAQFPGKSPATP